MTTPPRQTVPSGTTVVFEVSSPPRRVDGRNDGFPPKGHDHTVRVDDDGTITICSDASALRVRR